MITISFVVNLYFNCNCNNYVVIQYKYNTIKETLRRLKMKPTLKIETNSYDTNKYIKQKRANETYKTNQINLIEKQIKYLVLYYNIKFQNIYQR